MIDLPAVKAVDYLEKLSSHSRIGIGSLSSEFIKLIYGDSNDIISTFIQPLVSVFHNELKERTCQSHSDEFGSEWCLQLIVELVNKSSNVIEKTLIFTLS